MPVDTIEKQIDAVLEKQRAAQDEEYRAQLRDELTEQARLNSIAQEQARQNTARATYLARAEAAYDQACAQYKTAVDVFRAARIRLRALDMILDRSGFGGHHLGIELRHARAAPDEGDVDAGLGAAVDSIRKTTLGAA
jgi:hypothetical protein